MVKVSSARITSTSWSCSFECASSSGVVPLLPVVWEAWAGGVSVEDKGDEASEEVVRVSITKVLCDTFEGDDPADCLDNDPEIRQRLRTFHIV